MAVFKHGTYGEIQANGFTNAANADSQSAIVYIGTAPVNQIEGGAANVNKPILCNNIADARKYFGYSEDWAKYTLCEAMHVHFELKGVGPLVFINVFDPSKAAHKASTGGTASLTPENGRIVVANAEDAYLDSLVVKTQAETPVVKVKGTDYTASYDADKKVINIVELTAGALGSAALTVTWDIGDPAAVTSSDVIGSSDGYGLNTGVFAVKNVYSETGYIPAYILAPGFSSVPAVHAAMYQNSKEINGHWNAWLFVDMPLVDSQSTVITLATAATWKNANGYNKDNESVFFPMVKGTDGKKYHLSVLNCANFQELLIQNDGIPYMSGSNTDCAIIEDFFMGASVTGRVIDDELINRTLNANGIDSAAYVGGRWAIWGCMAASYGPSNATQINTFDTALMMLYYLTNDFQHRRNPDVDKPMTANDLQTMVSEEQSRLDALIGVGALTYGKASVNATPTALSDMYQGDFAIRFNVTTTPLAKSLTAIAAWTADGFVAYFASMSAA